ncbi:MAG TPA: DNRLRE domain-containing protein, partial [Bacteroides sp.]|nr:DNRLRE domain-containing protein [Bacteroides sp.]
MKAQHLIKFVMMLVLTGNAEALFAQSSGTYNLQITSDTYVSQFNPSNNYGRSADLVAGTDWEFGYLYRTYLRFDHTPIPADAEVLSAQLKIYMSYGTYYSEQYLLGIRKVSEVWDENTLNWKNQPGSASLVHIMTKAVDEEPGWKSFDITETVREWIGGSTKNRGVVMMAADESGELGECRFYSRESSGCRPYIQVIYLTNSMVPDSPDAPVCNMSGDDTPPDLDITFSKNPVELGSSTYVTVSASDSEGIHMVQLYRGNTLVITKTDDFARISLSVSGFVTPEEAGPVMFFAVAYNDRMQCTRVSERLLVQVDGEAPSVSIYHLPSHPAMGENVTFHASASDPSGIANLSIDVNGVRHFLDITQGANTVSGSLQINNANIFYDPSTTRLVTYAATSYDMEGNHTTYGPHTVIFGGNSGTDSDGDGLGDEIEEILGTDPHANDTDDDGLYDSWEVLGVDRDNNGVIDLDLPGFGASPHQKDLFIEVDWMEDANHSHKPHPWAIQTVINHFMCYGIRVHVDVGSMGGGNAVPHMEDMNIGDTKLNHLLNIKLAHCDPARYGIFRYALFGHGWGQYFGTGNMTVRSDPPNNENHYDEPYFQAKQFIHEIGHSLALGHGGQSLTQMSEAYSLDQQCYLFRNDVASWINTNYKPNYLSMMNYLYSSNNGLRARTTDGQDIMLLGFSQNLCGTHDLDENHLNESVGFNYPLDWGMYTWKRQGEI